MSTYEGVAAKAEREGVAEHEIQLQWRCTACGWKEWVAVQLRPPGVKPEAPAMTWEDLKKGEFHGVPQVVGYHQCERVREMVGWMVTLSVRRGEER